jgi:hypothetical protein
MTGVWPAELDQSRSPESPVTFAGIRPGGFPKQALCKIVYAGAVTSRLRFAHGFNPRLRRTFCVGPRPPYWLACFAALTVLVYPSAPKGAPLARTPTWLAFALRACQSA